MDPFGHIYAGCLTGELFAREHGERKPFWVLGIIAGTMPDIDAVTYLIDPAVYQRYHQVYTHNIFALILFPLVAGFIAQRFLTKTPPKKIFGIAYLSMAVHILGDLIAHWPVRLLYPLADRGWTFNLIRYDFSYGVDIILGIGVALCLYDRLQKHTVKVASGTIALTVLYIFLVGY